MAYEKKSALTKEQRAALKPMFQKIDSGYDELERALAALRPGADEGDDSGGGFCGMDCGCSSFLGPGKSPTEKCQRDFCKHRHSLHWT